MIISRLIERLRSMLSGLSSKGASEQSSPSRLLLMQIGDKLSLMAQQYNAGIDTDSLIVSIEKPNDLHPESAMPAMPSRLIAATPFWVLSALAQPGSIQFFLFPAAEMPLLTHAETPSRCKVKLQLMSTKGTPACFIEQTPLSDGDLDALLLGLFSDLTKLSSSDFGRIPEHIRIRLKDHSVTGVVKTLLTDKQRLISNMVSEQELFRQRLSREIHDVAIGDLLFLERCLSGDKRLSDTELCAVVNNITARLRAVCADLAPRDLHDWGLPAMLQDLAMRYHKRTGKIYTMHCPSTMPPLSPEVELHIYRIVQECLTNAEKHSKAESVGVSVTCSETTLTVEIVDNGLGFDPQAPPNVRTATGGTGTPIMHERVQLISATCPASLAVQSQPGKGTRICLQVDIAKAKRLETHDTMGGSASINSV